MRYNNYQAIIKLNCNYCASDDPEIEVIYMGEEFVDNVRQILYAIFGFRKLKVMFGFGKYQGKKKNIYKGKWFSRFTINFF